jgi:predicted ATPase
VAGRAMRHFADGVFFVELALISEADLVPPTIAQALGLPEHGSRTALDRLADHIGPKRMLLVLDNFEQVTDAGSAVNQLLTACPNLKVLVSSRSVLGVSGEQEYPVPPLGLPDPRNLPPLSQLSQYEAVALFIERARAVKPGFEVTNENAPAVAEICVRLDGLPLAIELAAARVRILTPQAMLARLGDRLGLLSGGSRDLPARQQTLRGAIAWSHDLLDETDRALFACLAVFVGGATLDTMEAVCGDQTEGDLLDALTSLVEKSLVRQREGFDGQPRFTMLETIRDFAIEQAVAGGRWETVSERHARAYAALAADFAGGALGSGSGVSLDRLEEEHDNLRQAYDWLLDHDLAAAMRMARALWRFLQRRGHMKEGLERVEAALARPESADHPEARADALLAAAGLSYWRGDTERARAHYTAEIEAREALGDRSGLAEAHYGMSFTYSVMDLSADGPAADAERHINLALEIYRDLGDESGVARCEWALANVLWGTRRFDEARAHALHSLELFESIDDRFMVGWASYTAGLAALVQARLGNGEADAAEAGRLLEQALRVFREAGDVTGYALVLDAMAVLSLHRGDRQRAARLTGAVWTLEKRSGTGLNPWNRGVLEFDPLELQNDPALADELAAGSALEPEAAVAFALGES